MTILIIQHASQGNSQSCATWRAVSVTFKIHKHRSTGQRTFSVFGQSTSCIQQLSSTVACTLVLSVEAPQHKWGHKVCQNNSTSILISTSLITDILKKLTKANWLKLKLKASRLSMSLSTSRRSEQLQGKLWRWGKRGKSWCPVIWKKKEKEKRNTTKIYFHKQ